MNKKFFILAIGFILSLSSVSAQVRVDRGYGNPYSVKPEIKRERSVMALKYGFKTGLNMSTMSNEMTFDPCFSMGAGFQVGALLNLHWGQRTASSLPGTGLLGLQPEILYSYQSVNTCGESIKQNYIQVPVMLKIYPLPALSIEVGPEFSYLIATSPDYVNLGDATVKVGDCKGLCMGAGAGVAYEFDFGLMAGARYSMGFSDLGSNLKWRNNCNIQITVGWLF